MKTSFFLLFLLLLAIVQGTTLQAQNLVPNPSFEEYSSCPNQLDQINKATGWTNYGDPTYSSSSDYFNSCSLTYTVSVPTNTMGFQRAAEGNAYAGLLTYISLPILYGFRESIGTQLISPLIIGFKYYVSVKVSNAIKKNRDANSATNNIGVLFSTVRYTNNNPAPFNNFAQIYCQSVISDTIKWTTISGSFIADSSYKNIMIGNFFDDAHTSIIQICDTIDIRGAYYYIDCVCVSKDSLTCNLPTEVQNVLERKDFEIYPNPAKDNIIITNNDYFAKETIVSIFNVTGQQIISEKFQGLNQIVLDVSKLLNNIYFIKIQSGDKIIYNKIIKQ